MNYIYLPVSIKNEINGHIITATNIAAKGCSNPKNPIFQTSASNKTKNLFRVESGLSKSYITALKTCTIKVNIGIQIHAVKAIPKLTNDIVKHSNGNPTTIARVPNIPLTT